MTTNNKVSKAAVKADLTRVARKLRTNSLTREEYRANGNFSSWLAEARYGSWTNAARAAK